MAAPNHAREHAKAALNCDYRLAVSLVGKDDKTNNSTARWGAPARAVVRQSNNAITLSSMTLKCADHDHSTIDNITPSVHSFSNVPQRLSDLLYVGDEGNAKLWVALHRATFEPSDVFKHSLSVLEDIISRANVALEAEGRPVVCMR